MKFRLFINFETKRMLLEMGPKLLDHRLAQLKNLHQSIHCTMINMLNFELHRVNVVVFIRPFVHNWIINEFVTGYVELPNVATILYTYM